MEASGDILLGHVNSVLDISRAEAGAMRMTEARFDVDRLVEEAVANQAGLAATAGNEIEIVALSGRIGRVQGDRGRIRQILLNLIGNAVKFTRYGKITIETEVLNEGEPDGSRVLVEFRVIDTGIGISETDLARIFEDFVTLDTSYDRTAGGTGLGLGIARRLAEAMGGEIGAESVEGEGSLFWLRLTLARIGTVTAPDGSLADDPVPEGMTDEDAPTALPADVPAMPPMSILVVEDNEINRFLLRRYLEAVGHRVTEAVDGIDGVALSEREKFDVILMDISMPRLDGIEATRRIRAGSGLSAQSRILALTAHAMPEEQIRFREAGMEAGLTKPIGRTDLLRALAGVELAKTAATTAVAEDPVVDRTSLTELVGQIGAETAALLVRRLMEEGEALVGRVLAMSLATDAAMIAKECHQLAGTCGTFGTRRLRGVLAGIEAAIGRQNLDEAARLLSGLDVVWTLTRDTLETESQAFAPVG
jgi:CheY-like chemotaxis protein/HPt (histidine-containing phosphotransfer) domain-containing protein